MSVTVLPKLTEYEGCCIVTTGGAGIIINLLCYEYTQLFKFDTVTLICFVSSNLPVTSVQWQRNVGGSITTISSITNTGKYSGSTSKVNGI
jgi:hypothetical protein